MNEYILVGVVAFIIGFIAGGAIIVKETTNNTEVALKISNIVNSSMLDCTIQKIITTEQGQLIVDILNKHIEKEFKFIKVNRESKEWKDY